MKFCYVISMILATVAFSAAREHPHGSQIQILSLEGVGKFKPDSLNQVLLHPDVRDRKIVSLSITGAFRRGKSFFLDYCLRFLYANYKSINTISRPFRKKQNWWGEPNEPLTGFSWKHGNAADTRGILIWNDAFLYEENGEKFAILLMDTQGLFEPGRSSEIDVKILGITSFLSSIEILNMQGIVQEDQLEHLKMVTDFSKVAVQRENENSLRKSSKPFQELLLLIRDFIDDDIGYGYEGGKNYFNNIFKQSEANNTKESESVRENIQNSFDHVYAVTLPHPGVKVTRKSYDGRWSVLEDEFKEYLTELISSLLSSDKLVKKKIFGNEVTGKELSVYAESLFKAFESLDLPQIDQIFNVVVKVEMEKMLETLIEEYTNGLKNELDYDREPFLDLLYKKHQNLQYSIIKKFKETPKIADKDIEKLYVIEIQDRTLKIFNEWKEDKIEHYNKIQDKKILEAESRRTQEEIEIMKIKQQRDKVDFQKRIDEENAKLKAQLKEVEDSIKEKNKLIDDLQGFDFDLWFRGDEDKQYSIKAEF